jgi:hypothetical protein
MLQACPLLSYAPNLNIKQIILPLVLYGCETIPSLTEDKLEVIENKVLRKIFEPEEEKLGQQFRILHRNYQS